MRTLRRELQEKYQHYTAQITKLQEEQHIGEECLKEMQKKTQESDAKDEGVWKVPDLSNTPAQAETVISFTKCYSFFIGYDHRDSREMWG